MRAVTRRCLVARLILPPLALAIALAGTGCSSSPAKSSPDGGGDASTVNVAWDWVGVIGTGQSLSVGGNAPSVTATQQPYGNLKLSFGGATVAPPFDPTIASLAVVPLVEPIRPIATSYPSAYPDNIYGETPHTAMANQVTALTMQAASHDYVTIHTVVGENGQALTMIEKNPSGLPTTGTSGRAYDATLFEATAITRLAAAAGKTYGIGAIVMTHGESDAGNSVYADDLYQLLTDYNQDLSAITGQTAKIPMLLSQQNSVPTTTGSVAISALQQWQAGLDHPGEII
ncbi:MAG TPA: dockerin, partial [Polyangia bacterium]